MTEFNISDTEKRLEREINAITETIKWYEVRIDDFKHRIMDLNRMLERYVDLKTTLHKPIDLE